MQMPLFDGVDGKDFGWTTSLTIWSTPQPHFRLARKSGRCQVESCKSTISIVVL